MAVSTGQLVKRQGRDGKVRGIGVAASKTIYEGTLVYLDAGGDATDVKVDANTVFAGIARETVDNSSGADGDKDVEVWTDGVFELTSASLAAADVGVAIYGSDNATTTKTSTGAPQVGTLVKVISATVGEIAISGLGE